MRVTKQMKASGARVLLLELGAQCTPDGVNLDDLAAEVFRAMLSSRDEDYRGLDQREVSRPLSQSQ
jgi:hypothetical protein